MKSVWLKNLAGDLISVSYEEDIYQGILDSIEIPEFQIVKLFDEKGAYERGATDTAEGEMLSMFTCEADFWLEIYFKGIAFTSEDDDGMLCYDIRLFSESQEEWVGTFYYAKGKFYSSESVVSLSDDNIEEEEIRIEGSHCYSVADLVFKPNAILSNKVKQKCFRELLLDEWEKGFRRTYKGGLYFDTLDES